MIGPEPIGAHLLAVTSNVESSPASALDRRTASRDMAANYAVAASEEVALAAFDRDYPLPDEKAFAVLIKPLFDFALAFGLPLVAERVGAMTAIYHEALAHVPADLLELAVDEVRRTWQWGSRMPLPADLLAMIEHDLRMHRQVRRALAPPMPVPSPPAR